MDARDIFARFFLPLYPPEAQGDPAMLARLRTTDANPAKNPSLLASLEETADVFVANAPALFSVSAADLALDRSDASVHRLSAALTPSLRDAWASSGGAGTAGNLLFNAVVHGAAYVGACVVASHDGEWRVRRPLWESLVALRSRAGEAELAVFHWWLKSLAGAHDGASATLADRYRTHVEVPCARLEELPRLVGSAPRALPRLKAPRYDLFHKYLRAHLPEVRDVGAHFPSPERFDGYGFRWIDFHVVGDGRMLLLAGGTREGLVLFWLSAAGFEKSAFYAGDAFPDPLVRVEGDRLVAVTSEGGRVRTHEMLWWGP